MKIFSMSAKVCQTRYSTARGVVLFLQVAEPPSSSEPTRPSFFQGVIVGGMLPIVAVSVSFFMFCFDVRPRTPSIRDGTMTMSAVVLFCPVFVVRETFFSLVI